MHATRIQRGAGRGRAEILGVGPSAARGVPLDEVQGVILVMALAD